ncbi:MAG: hypothetical protein K0R57_2287 [Paenibacillaceae bacterium]|nr:hypothetical protein [Paenibacillaceae bacterium]
MNDLKIAVQLYAVMHRLEQRDPSEAATVREALIKLAHSYDITISEVIEEYLDTVLPIREEVYPC